MAIRWVHYGETNEIHNGKLNALIQIRITFGFLLLHSGNWQQSLSSKVCMSYKILYLILLS